MHTTDIERIRAQVRRVADKADEIIEHADAVGDAGFDPAKSDKILVRQQELSNEVAQTLADFNNLMKCADCVESDRIQYEPERQALSVTHDSSNSIVNIEYTGSVTVPEKEITVTKAGTEVTPFSGDVTSGATASIDVSGLADKDEVAVEVTQHRIKTEHQIRSWDEVLEVSGATAPSVDAGGMTLPEHNLTKDTKTMSDRIVIGSTQSL